MKTPNLKPCPFCGGKANWLLEKTVANGLSNVQIAMPEPKAGAIMIAKVEMKSMRTVYTMSASPTNALSAIGGMNISPKEMRCAAAWIPETDT